jgi:ubiquinone/menaquinone biosynthesis C-methylase UbiE
MNGHANLDAQTVDGFGEEWARFDQSGASAEELKDAFEKYFSEFPWDRLPRGARGIDVGCGTGRWARLVAPRVGSLTCIDASEKALAVAQKNLSPFANVDFKVADVGQLPFGDSELDFGYSLGVLHHVPDTLAGIRECVRVLKPGAPFLLYLYYALDNRPSWYRGLWRASDAVRKVVSRLPQPARLAAAEVAAATLYWPLARTALLGERMGLDVKAVPLAFYRHHSFYIMRNDALDRFGTRLEQRFTRAQIEQMMTAAGLVDLHFREGTPYWCAVGYKRKA